MKVFMTGATGVIGKRAVPLLLERGHDVTVATRGPGMPRTPWARDVRVVHVDLFDTAMLAAAVRGHDAVVNLATHMPASTLAMAFRRAWRTNDRIRREGSRSLARAALAHRVERFVQESFALTYPDRCDCWIDESVLLDPAPYSRTVLDAEAAARRFCAAGRTGVVLRFAAFYGPDSTQLADALRVVRRGWAPAPGDPRGFISSVSHDDAAAAVVVALDAPAGAYNVSDDEPLRRESYFGELATLVGARPPRFPPRWATPLFGAVGGALARSLRLSNRKFRTATGWAPRYSSARDGLAATLAAMSAP